MGRGGQIERGFPPMGEKKYPSSGTEKRGTAHGTIGKKEFGTGPAKTASAITQWNKGRTIKTLDQTRLNGEASLGGRRLWQKGKSDSN